jgi:hypothetical protein
MMGRPWQKCRTSEIHCCLLVASCTRGGHLSYLLLDVVKRIGRVDSEADQDNVRIGVGERAETVVIFLASGIPEGELDVLAVNLDIGDVVLENGGNVDLEQRRLACALWNECRA